MVNVVNPLDGSIIPAYNLNSAKRGLIDRVDVNSTDRNLRSFTYSGFEFGAAARIGTGDAVRRLDDRPHDPEPLRRARELGQPVGRRSTTPPA